MSIRTEPAVAPEPRPEPRDGRPSDHQEHVVVIERMLDAPVALVWEVWTTPEHIERWWGHDDLQSDGCAVDLAEGGAFRLTLNGPDGTAYPCVGVIREIVPRRRLVFEGPARSDSPCGAGIPPRALVTVTFETIGKQTKLTVHTRFDTEAMQDAANEAGYADGWRGAVDRIADQLTTL